MNNGNKLHDKIRNPLSGFMAEVTAITSDRIAIRHLEYKYKVGDKSIVEESQWFDKSGIQRFVEISQGLGEKWRPHKKIGKTENE